MDLDNFIVMNFCLIDGSIPTVLADSEVLTTEVVGEFLGYDEDQAIFQYFRRWYRQFFRALAHIHRTTSVRKVANLWALKDQLWHQLVREKRADPVRIVDSVLVPVCAFAHARQTFYGFRLPVRSDRAGR